MPGVYAMTDGPEHGRAMRRRAIVFLAVFLVCAIASLSYTFMRPAIYLSSARLQVTPAAQLPTGELAPPDDTQAFLAEVQLLNSRPLLEKVVARLTEQGLRIDGDGGPVLALQDMLTVTPLEGTRVVRIEARGPQRTLLPRVVNELLEVYREQQALAGKSSTQGELVDAREALRVIDERVAQKRRAMEEFRLRHEIVSAERDENQTLSRLKGLGTSLSTATDREAIAAGKLRTLEQAASAGERMPKPKDNPTVAAMEQRLSLLRDEWRALERQFTPQYLDMDPAARSLKTRIANLEQQLDSERHKGRQDSLSEARDDLASAQNATRRLQQQMAEDKQAVQAFSRRMLEFQAMQTEMLGLDDMRNKAQRRLLGLEASEPARKPRAQVLEVAATPENAWRPKYWRDAAISLAASLLLAFLAVWFVEFFNRPQPLAGGPSTLVFPQVAMPHPGTLQLGAAREALSLPAMAQVPLLPSPRVRELSDAELRRLLANAAPENLPLLVGLLSGLSAEALAALRVSHLDLDAHTLAMPGEPGRVLAIEEPLLGLLAGCAGLPRDAPLFPGRTGAPLSVDDVHAMLRYSAHDANLIDALELEPETLHYTYAAFLVRQGLRFSDLDRLIGRIPAAALNALAPLAPGSVRVGLDAVDRLLPAVRELGAA
jgi:succinoglycan biosynthesis transport protein ExoP